jgi:hypothetical protein
MALPSTEPVQLDPLYLAALERVEARPENQSGADKTWVERALREFREHYAKAVRVR